MQYLDEKRTWTRYKDCQPGKTYASLYIAGSIIQRNESGEFSMVRFGRDPITIKPDLDAYCYELTDEETRRTV